ncbi:M20 family metallopeptidase [Streptomyces sp. NPDC015661]|uniref:M20 metallopeptidase family protein n=1 Tax=Streptomyces sp. NPDC015661 TaxID=3364961 RepID=UPI0036FDE57F
MPSYLQQAESMSTELVELRHSLHREPELGLHLPLTQAKVLTALDGLPLELTTGKRLTSVVAVLRGGRPGPVVLLRGDMDALPVRELADVPYASRIDGVMHACGHDQHTAMLAGAARLLSARQDELPGTVVFMFQPGEEGEDGARLMIEEGVLEAGDTPPVAAYSLHVVSSGAPVGAIGGRAGTTMAGSADLHVTVRGRGGHGSAPHQAADPVPVAAEMVTTLQTLVTRTANVFDPVVVTVGTFHAGTRTNVIPAEATFGATVRATSEAGMAAILDRARKLCAGMASAHGLTADVLVDTVYPAVVCTPEAVDLGEEVADAIHGPGSFLHLPTPAMGSEDFSRILARVPGAQFLVGAQPLASAADAPYNHSPHAVFDDGALPVGTALFAELADRRLRQG